MQSRTRRFLALSILSLAPFAATGCTTAGAAGPAGYTWYRGAYEGNVDGTTSEVTRAAEKAMRDLDMKEINASSTEIDGKVTGRSALDKLVTISIKRTTEKVSWVSIRVGSFGDDGLSQRIFDMIQTKR